MKKKVGNIVSVMPLDIEQITENMLNDSCNGRLKCLRLPDRNTVESVVDELFQIIYPGYFHNYTLKVSNLKHFLATVLEDVTYYLEQQINIVLRYRKENFSQTEKEQLAQNITADFMYSLPIIRKLLLKDIEAFYEGDPAAENEDEIIVSYPGLQAITVYRLAHQLVTLGVPVLPRIMSEYAHAKTGIDIHPGAKIGEYFFIDHGTGIVIGETTVIGNHVKIYQGVTLGGLSTRGGQSLRGQKRHPTIEDCVTIYSGATILGGRTVIGHDCVIGGNAFITKSVAPCTKVSVQNQEIILSHVGEE